MSFGLLGLLLAGSPLYQQGRESSRNRANACAERAAQFVAARSQRQRQQDSFDSRPSNTPRSPHHTIVP
jgi:hypothetical protein